jgi:SH3 domain-containing protein
MWRVAPNATPYLRVRSRPNGDILGGFLPNKEINVLGIENNWARLQTADNLTAWVNASYIVRDVSPSPVGYRKLSLHIHTGNNAAACVQVYRECAQAGKPLALAVVINNPSLCDEIKMVSKDTFVVSRNGINEQTGTDSLPLVENDRMANFLAGEKRFNERYIPCNADAFQCANEHYSNAYPVWKVEAMSQFYQGMMSAAKARRTRVTVGDFSAGTPEDYHLELMSPMLTQAEQDGHILNYHAYAPPDTFDMTAEAEWWVMRWERIVRNYPKLGVLMGEAGGYGQNGPDPMKLVRQLQAMLATNVNVIGAAVFTANAGAPWDTNGCGFDPYLSEFSVWHRSL